MPVGPQRFAPISKKVAKKAVLKPVSQRAATSGVVGDTRPTGTQSNYQRSLWGIKNRADKGDWTS